MDATQFTYWLQGYVEMGGDRPSEEQWQMIKDHLGLVFNKVTPTPNLSTGKGWEDKKIESPKKSVDPSKFDWAEILKRASEGNPPPFQPIPPGRWVPDYDQNLFDPKLEILC